MEERTATGLPGQIRSPRSGSASQALQAGRRAGSCWSPRPSSPRWPISRPKCSTTQRTFFGVGVKRFAAVRQLLDTILTNEIKRAEGTRDSANTRFTYTLYSAIAAIAFGLGLSALIALYMNRAIASPIAGMTSAMKQLAGGDLGADIPATGQRDEIGEMAKAVAIFRDGMIDADRLQKEQKIEQTRKEARQAAIKQHISSFEEQRRLRANCRPVLARARRYQTSRRHQRSHFGLASSIAS